MDDSPYPGKDGIHKDVGTDYARIMLYKEVEMFFGDYMKETRFVEKNTQAEEEIKKNPDDHLPYLKLFHTWLELALFVRDSDPNWCHTLTDHAEVYLTAAVRLGHDDVRAFDFTAYEDWENLLLPYISALQADTLEAKREGMSLEEWKEVRMHIPCGKCQLLLSSQKGRDEKKMVLRLDDSTGKVTCSWCGLEYNDESDIGLIAYRNMNDHIDWFWVGKNISGRFV